MKSIWNIWKKFGPLVLFLLLLIMVPVGIGAMGIGSENGASSILGNLTFADYAKLYDTTNGKVQYIKDAYFLGVFTFVFLSLGMLSTILLIFQDKLAKVSILVLIAKIFVGFFIFMTIILAVSYYGVIMNNTSFDGVKWSGNTIAGLTLIVIAGFPSIANSILSFIKK